MSGVASPAWMGEAGSAAAEGGRGSPWPREEEVPGGEKDSPATMQAGCFSSLAAAVLKKNLSWHCWLAGAREGPKQPLQVGGGSGMPACQKAPE